MSNHLRKVARARARWHETCAEANAAYLDAIRAARDAGHTMPQIGEAAGISKQAVMYLLNREKDRA